MNYIRDHPGNNHIRLGDVCVVHISEKIRYTLEIRHGQELQTKFGILRAEDLINHPYGTRFDCKRGWILPLRLTPELWTQLLPHRTQILYQADISMILLQLDIKPGSVVVESGTGSGSLSHAVLRACLPNGFLHTFDINSERVAQAQAEFIRHGFESNVNVTLRNVCETGFGPELEGKSDACILDLPQTWLAIEFAYRVLKPGGSRLCTFSPCIEQVQLNVSKMRELKFKDIVTLEVLLKPFVVKEKKLRLWDEQVLEKLADMDKIKMENLRSGLSQAKRPKIAGQVQHEPPLGAAVSLQTIQDNPESADKSLFDSKVSFNPSLLAKKSFTFAQQPDESVSHSGFLTFASKRS